MEGLLSFVKKPHAAFEVVERYLISCLVLLCELGEEILLCLRRR